MDSSRIFRHKFNTVIGLASNEYVSHQEGNKFYSKKVFMNSIAPFFFIYFIFFSFLLWKEEIAKANYFLFENFYKVKR